MRFLKAQWLPNNKRLCSMGKFGGKFRDDVLGKVRACAVLKGGAGDGPELEPWALSPSTARLR